MDGLQYVIPTRDVKTAFNHDGQLLVDFLTWCPFLRLLVLLYYTMYLELISVTLLGFYCPRNIVLIKSSDTKMPHILFGIMMVVRGNACDQEVNSSVQAFHYQRTRTLFPIAPQ